MIEPTTLGPFLRRERERRGLALRTISENTKVSLALLEGLEADDISRWPGGIFRRAFVRSYAQCVGLDADDVMRQFEKQFPDGGDPAADNGCGPVSRHAVVVRPFPHRQGPASGPLPTRSRVLGSAADLTVAVVLAFGCAAAGSRMLWPVLLIACYYAAGVMMTGTSPMVALLADALQPAAKPRDQVGQAPAAPALALAPPDAPVMRTASRHASRRAGDRPVRQRRGMQAPV